MNLEQQESFQISGPQLEVLGEAESRLPAPVRRRPVAAGVLAAVALASVFGIGGLKLRGAYRATDAAYTALVDAYGHGLQTDFDAQLDAAASFVRVAQAVLGESDPACQAAAGLIDQWNQTDRTPAAQYALNRSLYTAVDTLYNTAKAAADDGQSDQLASLYAEFTSRQALIEREGAAYNEEARSYNKEAAELPAALVGALWGCGQAELFEAGG